MRGRVLALVLMLALGAPCGCAGEGKVDPHIDISVSPSTVPVGETFVVVGEPVDIGLPHYTLIVDSTALLMVTYAGEEKPSDAVSDAVEIVSVAAEMAQVEFTLRALRRGTVKIRINATGEIHEGYPGPAYWGGEGSKRVRVRFVEP